MRTNIDETTCQEEAAQSDGEVSIMVLTEGPQLVVHDLKEWSPCPLSLKFQELPPVSCLRFVPSIPSETGDLPVDHRPSLKNLRYLSLNYMTDSKWPFHGGVPPLNYFNNEADYVDKQFCGFPHPSAMIFMGCRDGRLRIWDSTSEVPRHLGTVPESACVLTSEGRAGGVTSFDVCPISGLMAIGHTSGTVRLYQFTNKPQATRRVSLDESLVPYDSLEEQAAGWQYILRYSMHSTEITSVCLATKVGLLAVGDKSGNISLVDFHLPERVFQSKLAATSVSKLAFGYVDKQREEQNVYDRGKAMYVS